MSGLDYKKSLLIMSIALITLLESLNMDIQYVRIEERTKLIRVNLPPSDRNFVFQLVDLDLTFAINDSHSCLLGLLSDKGTPR